jgi:uncharacterized protein YbjT (DUF2867 family)
MTYLITGATGTVGSLVVRQLLERKERPRVFVRDRAKAHALYGDRVDVFTGDLADANTLAPAIEGADSILLLNSGPDLAARDEAAARIARASGVRHLVKLSSYDAGENVGTGVWHAQGEMAIRSAGIAFTFVRPSGFMSNALFWATLIRGAGVVQGCTGDGGIPFIHPRDIAEVATETLVSGGYRGETLPITGPEALSHGEMAAKIGAVVGKTIRFEAISEEDVRRGMTEEGEPEPVIEAHLSIYRAIREGRLAGSTEGVERVLGRKPIAFDEWVRENASAFR